MNTMFLIWNSFFAQFSCFGCGIVHIFSQREINHLKFKMDAKNIQQLKIFKSKSLHRTQQNTTETLPFVRSVLKKILVRLEMCTHNRPKQTNCTAHKLSLSLSLSLLKRVSKFGFTRRYKFSRVSIGRSESVFLSIYWLVE